MGGGGGGGGKQESRAPDDVERKVDPATARYTEEPQGTPLMQSYVSNIFTTGIMSEWVMSTIEENLATKLVSSMNRIFKAWTKGEKLKYDKCAAGSRDIND